MSKTLEQVVLALPCDGATTLAIIGTLKEAGLADATVYGLCETCGGSGKCQRCGGHGEYQFQQTVLGDNGCPQDVGEAYPVKCEDCNGTGACPDCTTVSVVTKGLRERAIDAACDLLPNDGDDCPEYGLSMKDWGRAVDAVLSTVLGKTRVAENILTVDGFVQHGGTTEFYDANAENPQPQDIAILEDE